MVCRRDSSVSKAVARRASRAVAGDGRNHATLIDRRVRELTFAARFYSMNRFGKLFTSAPVHGHARRSAPRERVALRVVLREARMTGWLGLVIMVVLGVGFAGMM